jgi:hypothetical protein
MGKILLTPLSFKNFLTTPAMNCEPISFLSLIHLFCTPSAKMDNKTITLSLFDFETREVCQYFTAKSINHSQMRRLPLSSMDIYVLDVYTIVQVVIIL